MAKKKTITIEYRDSIKNASPEAKGKALSVIDDYGFNEQTVSNWRKEAPKLARFLNDLSEALDVPISEFIKKV